MLPVFTLPFTLSTLFLLLSWPDKSISTKDRVFTVGAELKRPEQLIKEERERNKRMIENIKRFTSGTPDKIEGDFGDFITTKNFFSH